MHKNIQSHFLNTKTSEQKLKCHQGMAKVATVSALDRTTEAIKTATYSFQQQEPTYRGTKKTKKKQNPRSQCTGSSADQMGK